MNKQTSEYLVISRGQWDKTASPEKIQTAIDQFYVWLEQMVDEGKMKKGQRLAVGGKTVARDLITDGPFGESTEEIASGNPCLQCGLFYEIRPIDLEIATAFTVTNETPK
jgi:hypothetical protein